MVERERRPHWYAHEDRLIIWIEGERKAVVPINRLDVWTEWERGRSHINQSDGLEGKANTDKKLQSFTQTD